MFAEEELARELIVVPGVAAVDVSGGVREEVQVLLDLERLQATGLGITQVLDTLAANNLDVSGGRLETPSREVLVRTVGRFRTAEEIAALAFLVDPAAPGDAAAGRRQTFLRDFARVVDGTEDQRIFVLLNGQPAVKVSIFKQPEANTVAVVDAVRERLEELRRNARLPEGATLVNTGQARLIAQFPPGTPLATSRAIMAHVDAIIMHQPEAAYAFTTTGGFLFGSGTAENALRGSSTITFKSGTDVEAFVARVNRELAALNLVDVRLRLAPEQSRGLITTNSPVRAEIDIMLAGTDSRALLEAGEAVLAALDAEATLAQYRPDADPIQPEVQVRRDAVRATLLGLSSLAIGQTVQTALTGAIPTQLQRGERLVDVRVRLDKAAVRSSQQLAQLPITGGETSGQVRLADVAVITEGQSPTEIQRLNQREVVIIAGNLTQGASLGAALAEADRILANLQLPPGVVRLPSAAAASNRQLQQALLTLSALAVFFAFAVMAVQYNSLIDPFVTLFTVPLALVGGVLGLVLTGTAFSATALLGAVLLVGVIVGNGIILVERANQLREHAELPRPDAIQQAAPERLRPILITTLLATLGLVPLALGLGAGTALLRPLALVVLFGLSVGTVLTLFVVPCLYAALHAPFRRGA